MKRKRWNRNEEGETPLQGGYAGEALHGLTTARLLGAQGLTSHFKCVTCGKNASE